MAEVAEMVKCVKFASSLNPAEYEARKARDDEETFFMDYRGNVSKHVQEAEL